MRCTPFSKALKFLVMKVLLRILKNFKIYFTCAKRFFGDNRQDLLIIGIEKARKREKKN